MNRFCYSNSVTLQLFPWKELNHVPRNVSLYFQGLLQCSWLTQQWTISSKGSGLASNGCCCENDECAALRSEAIFLLCLEVLFYCLVLGLVFFWRGGGRDTHTTRPRGTVRDFSKMTSTIFTSGGRYGERQKCLGMWSNRWVCPSIGNESVIFYFVFSTVARPRVEKNNMAKMYQEGLLTLKCGRMIQDLHNCCGRQHKDLPT